MSWTTLDTEPGAAEVNFISSAEDQEALTRDLHTVVTRMIENRAADDALQAKQLAFIMNLTNGYIQICWYDDEKKQGLGKWNYSVEITPLWEKIGDSFQLNRTCFFAICDYMEEHIYDEEGNSSYDVFTRTEDGALEELVL